mgnify:CR=1 FL=1
MLALILATIINVNAQNTEKQKADNYLSTQGELTFTFQVNNHNEVDLYSRDFSIVNYTPNTKTVIAWANERQFRIFETKNLPFEVPTLENEVDEVLIYDVRPLAERVSNRGVINCCDIVLRLDSHVGDMLSCLLCSKHACICCI